MHLRDFIDQGGTFIALQNSVSLPIHFGLARGVSVVETEDLRARGSVLRAEVVDATSPIRYGYGDTLGVYFRQAPVLRMGRGGSRRRFASFFGGGGGGSKEERLLAGTARVTGRGTVDDPDRTQGRPTDMGREQEGAAEDGEGESEGRRGASRGGRAGDGPRPDAARTIVRFHSKHEQLLISGMLAGGDELAGTPAVIDVPLGQGHVVLFAINPMWRQSTQGMFSLVFNTILHFDHLDAGIVQPEEEETQAPVANEK